MKWLSRKLLVFICGTGLVIFGVITGWQWVAVAMAYMGINYLKEFTGNKRGQ